jgi:hypothetical protein
LRPPLVGQHGGITIHRALSTKPKNNVSTGYYKVQADRANNGKPKISMVFDAPNALRFASEVLMFGEDKYARGNWQKGLPWTEITDSLLRHVLAFNNGEDIDPESSLPHVGHILVNALFLAEMFAENKKFDDRTSTRSGATLQQRVALAEPKEFAD